MADVGAEFLFQVITERAERATVIITTNLPFSEWTQVFPNARLCKALLDRLTDRAHIIETGTESYRFRRRHWKIDRRGGREGPAEPPIFSIAPALRSALSAPQKPRRRAPLRPGP